MFLFPLEALVRHQKLFELFMIFPSTSSQFRYDKINNIFWRIHGLYAKKGDEIWNWNDNNLSILSERFQILNIYLAVFILKGGFSHFKGLMGLIDSRRIWKLFLTLWSDLFRHRTLSPKCQVTSWVGGVFLWSLLFGAILCCSSRNCISVINQSTFEDQIEKKTHVIVWKSVVPLIGMKMKILVNGRQVSVVALQIPINAMLRRFDTRNPKNMTAMARVWGAESSRLRFSEQVRSLVLSWVGKPSTIASKSVGPPYAAIWVLLSSVALYFLVNAGNHLTTFP